MPASPPFHVHKVAVLGAGVMGAQIAAHLVNANVPAVLFELPAKEGDPNGNVVKAIDGLEEARAQLRWRARRRRSYIEAANYDQHLEQLRECDLVIEAIAERMDLKKALYDKVAPHLAPHAVFASNTSGLSINALAQAVPEALRGALLRRAFLQSAALHVPGRADRRRAKRRPNVLDALEAFLTTTLGKGVIRAKDTPNFIANRVGVFSILAAFHHTRAFGLGFDVVDALTGPLIGRPKSATYRTADVVGLDTLAHVVNTMKETLAGRSVAQVLRPAGLVSRPAGAGGARPEDRPRRVPQAVARTSRCWTWPRATTVLPAARPTPAVVEILKTRDVAERFQKLRASAHPQAQFLWAAFRDMLHYCAYHLADIADNARDLDLAVRWGFGWNQGPFEIWQAAGWERVARGSRKTSRPARPWRSVPLPAWVTEKGRTGVHTPQGSFSPAANACRPRSTPAGVSAPAFPDRLVGETRRATARPCSRPTPCACGPPATTSASSASRARCTRSARTCSTA